MRMILISEMGLPASDSTHQISTCLNLPVESESIEGTKDIALVIIGSDFKMLLVS
jgi:hypothetical protein